METPQPHIHASMAFNDTRRALRRPVDLTATLRSSAAGKLVVRLTDISEFGCQVAKSPYLAVDCYLVLAIPTFTPFGATVVWSDGDAMGLRFNEPLHPAIVEHIVTMSLN